MRTGLWVTGLIAVLSLGGVPARAAIVYQNLPDLGVGESGNCLFNSACAAASNAPQRYAAQEFVLSHSASISAIGFTAVLQGMDYATSANWMFLTADGVGGLPGTLIASGSGAALSHLDGSAGTLFGTTVEYSFALLAGTPYYVALQEFSNDPDDYLLKGVATTGAANSLDGGASWSGGYVSNTSIAVTLYGELRAVSEPGSLVLLATGLLGLTWRRRLRDQAGQAGSMKRWNSSR